LDVCWAAHERLEKVNVIAKSAGCACLAFLLAETLNLSAALAQDADYAPGVWHYRSVACVSTTVKEVQPRLSSDNQKTFTRRDFEESGVSVTFDTYLGSDPVNHLLASVTHYQGTSGNGIMMAERKGDRVQVCFLSRPAPTIYCNPDKDGRGRVFRVYDYRRHAQYAGMNSEHDCGGA
jgi:hypothetical protein